MKNAIMQVTYFLNSLLKLKFFGTFWCSGALDESIKMLKDS